MALRNFFQLNKKSEYRNNYLPFDYYDFWITAKENENLRCRNKIRDYMHTPFDWDEDQALYLEPERDENICKSTQTSDRLSSGKNEQDKKDNEKKIELNLNLKREAKKSRKKSSKNVESNQANNKQQQQQPRRARSSSAARRPQTNNQLSLKENKLESRSFSSLAIQTPPEWNLRDYHKNINKINQMSKSVSMANLRPKRPPFANYGWATKTKDLSIKPTHNAIANKVLAQHNNKDAILELTLHRLKKDANVLANEYSAIESKVAEHFHNERSDSRAWNSEYDEKYPDYTATQHREQIYNKENPHRLQKSTLASNYPALMRGPKSAHKRIYFYD